MKKLAITITIVLFVIKAYSQQVPSTLVDCNDAKTQVEMNECAKKDFDKADKELNDVYKKIMSLLKTDLKQPFLISQKKWIEYRDTNCNVYGALYKGGSIMEMIIINCKTRVTLERVKELEILLKEFDK